MILMNGKDSKSKKYSDYAQSIKTYLAGTMLLGLVLVCAGPSMAQIDVTKSTVTATAKQLGVPIEGTFKKITAAVVFLPAQLAQSSAKVEIDVASYDMGTPEYNKEVTGKEWFNAAQFPKAIFQSSSIVAAGPDKYTVLGKLSLKGRVAEVSLPVTVKSSKGVRIFDGVLPIRRTVFNIGDGEWKDTSVVADEVLIRFHLVVAEK